MAPVSTERTSADAASASATSVISANNSEAPDSRRPRRGAAARRMVGDGVHHGSSAFHIRLRTGIAVSNTL